MGKPKKEPPGLDHEPSTRELGGMESLMPPPPPKRPNVVVGLLTLPLRLLRVPVTVVRTILGLPGRLLGAAFGRRRRDTTD